VNHRLIYSYRHDDKLTIGSFCSVANDVIFILSGEHHIHRVSTYPFKEFGKHVPKFVDYVDTKTKGPIVVGNDVWIGCRATILSGVKIGNGAVIGAGSVVVKDVPPFAIVGGVPAEIIAYRFNPDQIASLQKIGWWDWPIESIKSRENDMYDDIDVFIRKYNNE
jgi:acetyltransferase-like isoleucine patch superfamily enzyme